MTAKLSFSDGVIDQPWSVVMHGDPKIGKSSWAKDADKPIFLDLEKGTRRLNVRRVEPAPTTWGEMMMEVGKLLTGDHDRKTVVIDTLDRAEWMCQRHVCLASKVESIEEACKGYGRGYVAVYEEFRRLLTLLEQLREKRGMNILVLSHSKVGKVPNPGGVDWERWEIGVDKRIAALMVKEFEAILFAHYDVATIGGDERKAAKGVGGENRVLETQGHPAWQAGNRFNLPPQLPLTYSDFADAMNPDIAHALRAEITEWLPKLSEAKRKDALVFLENTDKHTVATLKAALTATITYATNPKENA